MNMTTTQDKAEIDSRTLRIERDFKVSVEKMFQAWTDPEYLARWFGPEGVTVRECNMDVRVGGTWNVMMTSGSGEHSVEGVYREIKKSERIAFSWAWRKGGILGHETEVVITLKAIVGGTRMTLHQSRFETTQDRNDHNGGWCSSFRCLDNEFIN